MGDESTFAYDDKIMLPVDHLVSKSPEEDSFSLVKENIPEGMCGYDMVSDCTSLLQGDSR